MSCVRRCLRLSQLCLSYKSTSNAVTRQTHVSCDTKCDDAHALQSLTLLDTPGPLPPLNVSRLKRFEHAGSFPGIITYRIIYPQFGTLTPLRLKPALRRAVVTACYGLHLVVVKSAQRRCGTYRFVLLMCVSLFGCCTRG